jgi:hypothetical protein
MIRSHTNGVSGVYIGALTKLYEDSGDDDYLQEAEEAAAAAMETTTWTDGNGMLTEAMTNRSGDGIGFKCKPAFISHPCLHQV